MTEQPPCGIEIDGTNDIRQSSRLRDFDVLLQSAVVCRDPVCNQCECEQENDRHHDGGLRVMGDNLYSISRNPRLVTIVDSGGAEQPWKVCVDNVHFQDVLHRSSLSMLSHVPN